MVRVTAIIAAAGRSTRMGGGINKVFIPLFGRPVLMYSVALLATCPEVRQLIVVASPDQVATVREMIAQEPPAQPWLVVPGGRERQDSVYQALAAADPTAEIILVHDGARPLAERDLVRRVLDAAQRDGAACAAVPLKDTVKVVKENGVITHTPDRRRLWAVQTPQAFAAPLLKEAHRRAHAEGYYATDDAALVERLGRSAVVVEGSYRNLKITTPEDLTMARALLAGEPGQLPRVGHGYDVHRLVPGRPLVLGGVMVPHKLGLAGHSDADVLLHAIMDALLGAAALGDIGRHFPPDDDRYKDIDSTVLLAQVRDKIAACGLAVHNIDATVVAERPRLVPYISAMRRRIAQVLKCPEAAVNVKATTTEGLGFAGRQEGIAAHAVAALVTVPCINSGGGGKINTD